MYETLKQEIERAKKAIFPIYALYQVLGRIQMARQLGAITCEEYLELDHETIHNGINKPEYFNK